MVTQLTMVPSQGHVSTTSPSLLFNNALVTALQDLTEQAVRHTTAIRPNVLCLGKGSEFIPDLVANCACKALSFQSFSRESTAHQDGTFEVVILLADEQFTLNKALLNQINRCLTPQGRLIVVTPYQARFIEAFQRSFGMSADHQLSRSNACSVSTLFQRLSVGGFRDPYLRLIGGLPGFWESVVCSVTPDR